MILDEEMSEAVKNYSDQNITLEIYISNRYVNSNLYKKILQIKFMHANDLTLCQRGEKKKTFNI